MVTLPASGTGAQTNTAEISGVVRDVQGGVLPGATVVAEHLESGTRGRGYHRRRGRLSASSLRVGTPLRWSLSGFRRWCGPTASPRSAVGWARLRAGGRRPHRRDHGDGRAPLLQAANAEISDVIENREVVQLPLNGRNFLALAQLSDAVVLPPGGTRGDALQQAGPLPNVGGQRSGHNIYLLDGVKVTDELFNNLVINPSVDSIQEFKIQKSQYSGRVRRQGVGADQRGDAGRHATRVRGSAVRVPPPRALRRAQLLRSATTSRSRRCGRTSSAARSAARSRATAPSSSQLRGAAHPPLADAHVLGADRPSARRFLGLPRSAIRCDRRGRHLHAVCRQSHPGERIDPLAAAFLQHVPLPNRPARAAEPDVGRASRAKDVDQISLRLDHRFSSGDQLFARFSTFDADEMQPFGTSACRKRSSPASAATSTRRARNLGVSHTQRVRHVDGERAARRLDARRRRSGERRTAASTLPSRSGLQGVTTDPRDVGYPADLDARALQHVRRSDVVRLPRQPALRAVRQPAGRSRRAPLEVRRLLLSPAVPARAAGQRARRVHLHRASSAATRLPISCSAIRRPPSPASAAATRTAGPTGCISSRRTTGACAQPDASTSASATSTTSTCATSTTGCRRSTT